MRKFAVAYVTELVLIIMVILSGCNSQTDSENQNVLSDVGAVESSSVSSLQSTSTSASGNEETSSVGTSDLLNAATLQTTKKFPKAVKVKAPNSQMRKNQK